MTTLTPNKGYTLPVVGADFGTWGSELNANLSIIDANLGGGNTVSIAASSGSTYVVTTTQAENVIQQLTGALTGNVTYEMPAEQGFWLFQNLTTGAYNTFISSAGGGLVVPAPQNYSQLLWSDGTNIFPAARVRLGANLNLYVNESTGSDSNQGYGTATAYKTIQAAVNAALDIYDPQGNSIIINVADGTYTAGATISGGLTGGNIGSLFITGDTAIPNNCAINVTAAGATCFTASAGAIVTITGFAMSATGTGGCCLQAITGAEIVQNSNAFGVTNIAHMTASTGGIITVPTGALYYVTGNSTYHMLAAAGGYLSNTSGSSSSPTICQLTNIAFAMSGGWISAQGPGYVISVVNFVTYETTGGSHPPIIGIGPRYLISLGGVINTGGGGNLFFPGNNNGVNNGGYYA